MDRPPFANSWILPYEFYWTETCECTDVNQTMGALKIARHEIAGHEIAGQNCKT